MAAVNDGTLMLFVINCKKIHDVNDIKATSYSILLKVELNNQCEDFLLTRAILNTDLIQKLA